jgi:hypothetical protein
VIFFISHIGDYRLVADFNRLYTSHIGDMVNFHSPAKKMGYKIMPLGGDNNNECYSITEYAYSSRRKNS